MVDIREGLFALGDGILNSQLFDAQLACLFHLSAQLVHEEIEIPLPNLAVEAPDDSAPPFNRVMDHLLNHGQLMQELGDMAYSIVAYTLYRLCLAAASLQLLAKPPHESSRYNLEFPLRIKQCVSEGSRPPLC